MLQLLFGRIMQHIRNDFAHLPIYRYFKIKTQ